MFLVSTGPWRLPAMQLDSAGSTITLNVFPAFPLAQSKTGNDGFSIW